MRHHRLRLSLIHILTAQVAAIAEAKIAGASITSAQIDDLDATVASILHAQVATGEFDFAEVENLLSSVFVLGPVSYTHLVDSGDRLEKRRFARAVVADKPIY